MANEINLVPEGAAPKNTTLRLVTNLKFFNLIGTIVFFMGVFAIVAMILINSQELNASNKRQEKYKASIKNMQKTENQYILVKDRVDKIENILATEGIINEIKNFDSLKSGLPSDISFNQVSIDKKSTQAALVAQTYTSLAQTLANLVSLGIYKNVILNSFTFTEKSGYFISLELSS